MLPPAPELWFSIIDFLPGGVGNVFESLPKNEPPADHSMFTANFIGKCNFFKARKKSAHSVEIGGKTLLLPNEVVLDKIVIGIRPERSLPGSDKVIRADPLESGDHSDI